MSIPNPGYQANRPGQYRRVRAGMDPDTRRLIMFAGGLAGVLVCLIGASTLLGHRSGKVPVVTADSRPIRVKPENPGGMRIDGAENEVLSGGADNSKANLAPAAEAPDRNGLQAPAAVSKVAPASPDAETRTPREPVQPPAAAASAVAPALAPVKSASATSSKPSVTVPPPAVADGAAPGAVHKPVVQLAAMTTEQAAHEYWRQLTRRMPDLLNGHQPIFSRIEHDGHTFWRIRTTGFSDSAKARAFCDQVRAKGGGCSLAGT